MSNDRPTGQTISLEEATISNMWESPALVEVLKRKGVCTKLARSLEVMPTSCSLGDRGSRPDSL